MIRHVHLYFYGRVNAFIFLKLWELSLGNSNHRQILLFLFSMVSTISSLFVYIIQSILLGLTYPHRATTFLESRSFLTLFDYHIHNMFTAWVIYSFIYQNSGFYALVSQASPKTLVRRKKEERTFPFMSFLILIQYS